VQGADGALANTLVGVLSEGHHSLNGLLEVGQEGAASVGNQVTNNLDSNLLLERQRGGSSDIIPVILVVLVDLDILDVTVELVIIIGTGNFNLAAVNNHLLADEIPGSFAEIDIKGILVLLNALEETLDNTVQERRELLAVDLGHSTPEDVSALLEARVTEVEGLLGGTHQRLDVRLVTLRASSSGHLTHSISDTSTEIKLLLTVLDSSKLLEQVHRLVEEREEGVTSGGGEGTKCTGGKTLDLEVGVLEELVQNGHKLGLIGSNVLLIQTVDNSIDGADTGLHDVHSRAILLTLVLLHGTGQVLEEQGHEALVLSAEVLGQVVGEAGNSVERSLANLGLGVGKELENHGEDLLHLSADEVGSTLNAHTEGHDTGTAVVGVGVVEVLTQRLEQRHDDLAGGQALGENVEQTQSGAGRGDVVVVSGRVIQLSDDLESSASELLTETHALDLELAVLDTLHQEADGLSADVLVSLSVGGNLVHEDDQVLEVDSEEGGVQAEQGLEDLKGLHDTVLLVLVDGILEDSDHGGNHLLESLDGGDILLGVKVVGKLAQSQEGVDADLGALGVTDGLVEQGEQVLELLLEALTESLKNGEQDVDGNGPLVLVAAVSGLQEDVGQISPLAVLEINLGNSRDDPGDGVTDKILALAHGSTKQLLPNLRLLSRGNLQPVLLDETTGLDGGQLTEVGVLMAGSDLDEEDKGLRLAVELFLQDAGGFLDISLGGWREEARVSEGN
jgi:hypothetical protein